MGIIILKTDGTITHTDFPTGTIREQTKGLAALIGCKYIERVHLANAVDNFGFPKTVNMIVDEEGALKQDKVLNRMGSILYDGDIYGTVLFCGEENTEDGPAFSKMDDADEKIVGHILKLLKDTTEKDEDELDEDLRGVIRSLKGKLTVTLNGHMSTIDGHVNNPTAFAFAAYVLLSAFEKEFGMPFKQSLGAVESMNHLLDCETRSETREMTISVADLLRGKNNGQQSSGTEEQKEG